MFMIKSEPRTWGQWAQNTSTHSDSILAVKEGRVGHGPDTGEKEGRPAYAVRRQTHWLFLLLGSTHTSIDQHPNYTTI
jgi:hypothetical protein